MNDQVPRRRSAQILFGLLFFFSGVASASSLTDYFTNRQGVWTLVAGQFTHLHPNGEVAERATVTFHENEVLKYRQRWFDGFETCTSDDLEPDEPIKCRDGGNEWLVEGTRLIFIKDKKRVPVRLIETTPRKLTYFYALGSMTYYVSEEITNEGVWIMNRKTRYKNGSISIDYLSAKKAAKGQEQE